MGVVAALAVLEVLLRLGGVVYQWRPARPGDVSLTGDGDYRVLCLGESTTAGLLTGENSYPDQLEVILNERAAGRARFEVVNGGMAATTTDVILRRLPDLLAEHQPQVVVTMMGINDGTLIDPAFQVGGSLRVWKLVKMLYHTYNSPAAGTQAEELLLRARQAVVNWPDVAVGFAEEAARLAPHDPRPLILLAEAHVRQDQIDSARDAYSRAVEVDDGAVLAYSFEVEDRFLRVLDWVLSRFNRNADALAARAVLALRRGETAAAHYYTTMAAQLEPRNPINLVLQGHLHHLSGFEDDAQLKFEEAAALNPRLLRLLVKNRIVQSEALGKVVARTAADEEPADPTSGAEHWFRLSEAQLAKRFDGLRLVETWERLAKGETGRVEANLTEISEGQIEMDPQARLRALGQLAILAWQVGDAARAELLHRRVEEVLAEWKNPVTTENYRALWKRVHDGGIPLVAVQYPIRRLDPLRDTLAPASDVVFVDNERTFKDALVGRPYTEIFTDLFAGDFGHLTPEGNRLLAANVAEAVLTLVPEVRGP